MNGIVFGIHSVRGLGWRVLNQDFSYRGNQGIDVPLYHPKLSKYGILEAKHGEGLNLLKVYKGPLRQGAHQYNISRLTRYIRSGSNPNKQLANQIIAEIKAGNVDSFASFYKSGALYQLNYQRTTNFRLNPHHAVRLK